MNSAYCILQFIIFISFQQRFYFYFIIIKTSINIIFSKINPMNKQMSLTAKNSKIYSIAIELSQYSNQENLKKNNLSSLKNNNSYRLPKIIDVDEQDKTNRKSKPFENIFNHIENHQKIKLQDLNNQKSFNIVGKKQVKAYQNKITKKKNVVQRRNQSALSLSRYSSSVKSQNQNSLYLNKQDVLSFIRPSQNQSQNQTKMLRQDQMATIGSHKSSSASKTNMKRQSCRLIKCKQKLMSYTKTWNEQKLKKTKFPSILDHIAKYRSKVQFLENNAINEQKNFTKDKIWIETLRTQKNMDNYYSDKYVQKIFTAQQNFSLKGKDKLQKQMNWIDEKDKAGYTFAFLDSLNIKVSPKHSDKDKNNYQESILTMNRTMMGRQMLQKSKQAQSVNGVNNNEVNGSLNTTNRQMKNVLSSLRNPPALSKFSNGVLGSTVISPIKPKSIIKNGDDMNRTNSRLSKLR